MLRNTYDQLRAELLERVDIDADENAKLVSGGIGQPCGSGWCYTGDTCCPLAFGGWGCCNLTNAVCCNNVLMTPSEWCCPEGFQCNFEMDPGGWTPTCVSHGGG